MALESLIDRLTSQLQQNLPPPLRDLREEVGEHLRGALRDALSRLDLVTREEFDVQTAVLSKTRLRVEALERQLKTLETRVATLEKGTGAQ